MSEAGERRPPTEAIDAGRRQGSGAGERRCPRCGLVVGPDASFCPRDGAAIERREPNAPPARLTPAASEDDWGPTLLCAVLAAVFAGAAHGRASPPAYGLAAMFAILAIVMVLLNSFARRS